MIMRNIDACIECEKDVYEDEMNFDCEGNCYCPECFLAILGSPHKEDGENSWNKADIAGASDYSYKKPSRRQRADIVLPSLRQPVPNIAVVVDTSGSISDQMLAEALAEVKGILKALGYREGIQVLSVDSAVHTCQKVYKAEQVKLAGGGGTNMGAGIKRIEKLKPRPQVCVVITDGYTPWPDNKPTGMKVIVVLTDSNGSSPDWAKTVKIAGS